MFIKFLALMMVALVFSILAVHFRVEAVREGYKVGRLSQERDALHREVSRLAFEIERLKSPPVVLARIHETGLDLVPPPGARPEDPAAARPRR